MTFGEIKNNVRSNLADAGVVLYSEDNLSESLQDGYDDVAFQTHCIIKKRTDIDFQISPYIDLTFFIEDYLTTTAIFNNNTKRWLLDCLTVRDFDKIRDDWELWTGSPLFWAQVNFQLNALVPYYVALPLFKPDIYYAATAPTITSDSDSPLIASDFQNLLEHYVTADLLEQDEEFVKAGEFWQLYVEQVPEYRNRVKRLAKRDLLLIA